MNTLVLRRWVSLETVLLATLAVGLAGCDAQQATGRQGPGNASTTEQPSVGDVPDSTRPYVVCTTGQVADLIAKLAGDRLQVECLMGPGVDPHLFTARPSDVSKLNRAELLFYNGLHLEGRLGEILHRMSQRKETIAVTDGLRESHDGRLRQSPEFEGHYDPHVWHDASLWADCARYAAARLSRFDPRNAADYAANCDEFVSRLNELHGWAGREVAKIDPARRVLLTAHDAFGYLGRAYGLEVHGLQGISTVDEPDARTMESLVSLIVERQVKAVFVESSVAPRGVEALIEGCAARGHRVTIGGELYSDAMGAPGSGSESYIGMFEHNIRTITGALE
jgi:manganese/zinc/iron transport system substrate-binding protein